MHNMEFLDNMRDLELLKRIMEREWQNQSIYLWIMVLANLYYGLKLVEGADELQAEWWVMMFTHRLGGMTAEQIKEEGLRVCNALIEKHNAKLI